MTRAGNINSYPVYPELLQRLPVLYGVHRRIAGKTRQVWYTNASRRLWYLIECLRAESFSRTKGYTEFKRKLIVDHVNGTLNRETQTSYWLRHVEYRDVHFWLECETSVSKKLVIVEQVYRLAGLPVPNHHDEYVKQDKQQRYNDACMWLDTHRIHPICAEYPEIVDGYVKCKFLGMW